MALLVQRKDAPVVAKLVRPPLLTPLLLLAVVFSFFELNDKHEPGAATKNHLYFFGN